MSAPYVKTTIRKEPNGVKRISVVVDQRGQALHVAHRVVTLEDGLAPSDVATAMLDTIFAALAKPDELPF